MDPLEKFKIEVQQNIEHLSLHRTLHNLAKDFMLKSSVYKYTYNFSFLDRPIIQFPQDIIAMQELIWKVKPDLIIETGIAHGGSLMLSASVLTMIDYAEALEFGIIVDPKQPKRKVIGIDIDIRHHNREAIENHFMANRIEMIQGSSIDLNVTTQVHQRAAQAQKVMVVLDSNHTHEHVLAELQAYAPLVSCDSYCIVFDTSIEDCPDDMFPDRPWGKGNNPKTAVWEYLKTHPEFEIDKSIQHKLLITVAPDGYLKRVR